MAHGCLWQMVTFSAPIRFVRRVDLRDGCCDRSLRNYSFVSFRVFLDTIPPQISIISPAEGAAVNTPIISVTGTVTDQNIAGLTLTVNNGQPQSLTLAGSNFSGITSLSPGLKYLDFHCQQTKPEIHPLLRGQSCSISDLLSYPSLLLLRAPSFQARLPSVWRPVT